MYLLDINILSELMRPMPSELVLNWLDEHGDFYICAITVAELLFGAYRMADGKKKQRYLNEIHAMTEHEFLGRILPFDSHTTQRYTTITAMRLNMGKPIHTLNAQIASIASVHGLTLVTRNIKDFLYIDDLVLINPFLPH